MTSLRVAIVEDDPQLRADFTRLVEYAGDMTCACSCGSAEEALAQLGSPKKSIADVVLMDINLPGISGIECVRRLRAAAVPQLQIVMLTTFDDSGTVFESLQAGASGYLLKRSTPADVLDAIRDVASGGAPMTGAIARKVVQYFGQRGPAPEVESLTSREREVLVALSQGLQYKEIADTLSISINTVRKYIREIYEKLHVSSRHDAISKLGRR
jgi:DNA-binding NarL/FixJ family response regulator